MIMAICFGLVPGITKNALRILLGLSEPGSPGAGQEESIGSDTNAKRDYGDGYCQADRNHDISRLKEKRMPRCVQVQKAVNDTGAYLNSCTNQRRWIEEPSLSTVGATRALPTSLSFQEETSQGGWACCPNTKTGSHKRIIRFFYASAIRLVRAASFEASTSLKSGRL
jgi:hypothetical protein